MTVTALWEAHRVLLEAADLQVLKQVDRWVAEKAEWRYDPEIPGVVGLVLKENRRRAVLIVYLEDRDFEEGSEFWGI
jgi:hypothetical protein